MLFVLAQVLASAVSPGTTDSLTLRQALDRALSARPQVVGAGAAVDRARGAGAQASIIPNPSAQIERDNLAPTYKATVVQPLGWLPRRGADVRLGRALVGRAVADSAQTMAEVGRQVRDALYSALAADERLRLLDAQAAMADSLVRFAERRVSTGDISALERDQIAQEASLARLAARHAATDARVATIALGRAVAWQGTSSPRAAGSLSDGLDDRSTTLAGGERGGADLMPAVRAATADSVAAEARLSGARVARLPIPALVVGSGWGSGSSTTQPHAIFGLSVPLQLWNVGGPAVTEATAAARESAALASEARLAAAAELRAAHTRLDESAARARFARDSLLPEASRIRAGAVRLYEAGRTGILPVFDALRAERELSQTVVQELLAFQLARADMLALLGRWE